MTDLRFPGEWEPHAATWLAWPHNRMDWPGRFHAIPFVYAEILRHLARRERVDLLVQDEAAQRRAQAFLARAHAPLENIRFHIRPTDRIWMRDSGCTFVKDGDRLKAVAWTFNAWAKYDNWQRDREVAPFMAQVAGAPVIRGRRGDQPLVLEGGSIDADGRGTLLTTEECLLSDVQVRNPGMTRDAYERAFAEHLGIRKVIWLGDGVKGDDTHGHVDDLSRFVAPRTVVTVVEPRKDDPNHAPLAENLRRLKAATDADGHPLEVIELPMPGPLYYRGVRLPASYGNFYIANGLVLCPVFNDPHDRHALDTLAKVFPDREVVGIYSGDFIWGFGAMHCMSQQQPA
ncbi:agmatine deiminase family protein [Mesoterricola sediminis]|uniref:Agmatine deiminase n=1 Tax=Mesoterricola sediminis TaxID=2927980 RepID=A0AA48GUA6_9BACT|nr:agmatine deiminase family protein [Mesoterricola sediminis]BDU75775.1 agmatine deiminase [Mesoterricola sediminis]